MSIIYLNLHIQTLMLYYIVGLFDLLYYSLRNNILTEYNNQPVIHQT
jgi:hypothetical protein